MQKAYFKNIRFEILQLLQDAQSEVSIAMAWFTSAELFSSLISCLKRNVKVTLILLDDHINFMEYAPDFNDFIRSGGILFIASPLNGFMHHKFCIIDHQILISGSYNWTYYAEVRNIENIFITDDSYIIESYQREFNSLRNSIKKISTTAPRYSMLEIESHKDLDFNVLNYEIENICRIQNQPKKYLIKTNTEVNISETKLQAIANNSIGILVNNDHDTTFEQVIGGGSKLPVSVNKTFYLDSRSNIECPCKIVQVNPSDPSDVHLIKEEDIFRIATGTNEMNLQLKFSMKLEDNGSLRVDVSCDRSGKCLTISALDKNLVKYVKF